jgi:primase-polymerase (primpol)-like protein
LTDINWSLTPMPNLSNRRPGDQPRATTNVHPTLKVGDLIQWTINGQDQFPEPRAILKLDTHNGDLFVFVEGTSSGIPADQVAVVRPARPPSAHIDEAGIAAIPPKLIEAIRWVVWTWKWVIDDKGNGKWDKPPIDPKSGAEIDQTDPKNWMTFHQARRAARKHGDGIGLALGPKDNRLGVVGIDLDHCIDPGGRIDPRAMEIVRTLDSYTERTPSDTGLRVLIWGDKPGPRCRTSKRPGIELYEADRYLTVSGRHLEGTPTQISRRDEALVALYDEMFPEASNGQVKPSGQPSGPIDASDDELIQKARRAKTGAKFSALFDRGDVSGYAGDDSAADMALANMLAFWLGRDFSRIEAMFGRSGLGQRDKWRTRADYRQRTIDKAIDECAEVYKPRGGGGKVAPKPSGNGDGHQQGDDKRPEVLITTEEADVNDKAIDALKDDACVYQRNFKLVTIAHDGKPKGAANVKRAEGTPVIRPIQAARLREMLTRVIRWKKVSKDQGDVDAHPPMWAVNAILAREEWPTIRYLVGITETPTLRSDGSAIEQPGYDEQTGLLYVPNGKFPAIPASPDHADAEQAAKELLDLVADFPFKPNHKAGWLAGLLTPMARFLIDGAVPLFLFEANTSGAGKTLLCDVISLITTGRIMTRTGYYHDPTEMDKQIVATALAGDRTVLFDNIENGGRFGNSSLDRALTARSYRGRVLGKSEMTPDLDLCCVFYGTGNNLSLCGDIPRRLISCRLESPMEKPEERSGFRIPDLLKHVAENRGRLVVAGLTILRAYIRAGKPHRGLTPMDFTAWSSLVRNAIHWATGMDPAEGRKDLSESNPDRQHEAALVHGWYEVQQKLEPGGMTSATMIRQVEKAGKDEFVSLRDTLAEMWPRVKPGELPSSGSIGMKIQAIRGKSYDGLHFECVTEVKRSKVWKVVASPKSGESGESSESFSPNARENPASKPAYESACTPNSNGCDSKKTHQTHQTHQDGPVVPRDRRKRVEV